MRKKLIFSFIAILISQDNKSWYYFSINGNNVYSCGSGTSSPKSQKSGDSSFSGGGKTNLLKELLYLNSN